MKQIECYAYIFEKCLTNSDRIWIIVLCDNMSILDKKIYFDVVNW